MLHTRHGTWGGFGASSAHPGPDVPIPGDNLGSPETPHGPAPRQLQTLIVGPWQTRSRRTSSPWVAQPARGRRRATAYRTDRPHAYPTIDQERGAF